MFRVRKEQACNTVLFLACHIGGEWACLRSQSDPEKNLLQALSSAEKFAFADFGKELSLLPSDVLAEFFKERVAGQRHHHLFVEWSKCGRFVLGLLLAFLSDAFVLLSLAWFLRSFSFASCIVEKDLHDLNDFDDLDCFSHPCGPGPVHTRHSLAIQV